MKQCCEFSSLEDVAKQNWQEPIVVRTGNTGDVFSNLDTATKILSAVFVATEHVRVYKEDGTPDYYSGESMVRMWNSSTLTVNAVDGEVLELFQLIGKGTCLTTEEPGISLVMSKAGNHSRLHVDYTEIGSWMFLAEGEKEWTLINPSRVEECYDPSTRTVFDLTDQEMNKFGDDAVRVVLRAGDMLLYPPYWMHRVNTPLQSIGLNGSIDKSGWEDTVKNMKLFFKSKGITTLWYGEDSDLAIES